MTIHFDEVLPLALSVAESLRDKPADIVILRDVLGTVRLIARPHEGIEYTQSECNTVNQILSDRLGAYSAANGAFINAGEFINGGSEFLENPARRTLRTREIRAGEVSLLERTVVGEAWSDVESAAPNWITSYSFKGGVGRSTATAWLAQKAAAQGDCVLVVDLDLESPGVSALLQDPAQLPDYGLVDYLVESAVSNPEDLDLVSRAPFPYAGNGELWIAPASGRPRDKYDYIEKLNRVYLSAPSPSGGLPRSMVDRFRDSISACVTTVEQVSRKPDLVLLDSRAGIHDVAAIAISHLCSTALLFASNDPATWAGYSMLLRKWGERPDNARVIRDRVKMVAAMTPAISDDLYLQEFRERAAACFESVYDELSPGDEDAYNPAVDDDSAPHFPLPIRFDLSLRNLDHVKFEQLISSSVVDALYEDFYLGFQTLVSGSQ
jgi:hypothetical protein